MKRVNICIIPILLLISFSYAQKVTDKSVKPTGMIKGKILDSQTQESLSGVNVILINITMGAATDLKGQYSLENVPVGDYQLQFSYIGYKVLKKTDIIVRPQRITVVNGHLKPEVFETEAISVSAGYFAEKDEQPLSLINFSREEIRRAPGSAGDVSRIIMSLPCIAKINDQSNSLIVRGGSPLENSFYIDNIEIPNINHFPTQGSSGGPIGIINVDFIEDVEFYSGGFSPTYGDKLSSVMNIRFREGNREEFDGQLDFNWAGIGGVFEGPVFNQNGSWLFSARRSYLDWVIKMFNTGTSIAPSYGDIHSKVVYDLNPHHTLSVLGIFADSHSNSTKNVADENAMTYYGNQALYEFSGGVNWRALWPELGYSNTSLSYMSASYNEDFNETATTEPLFRNRSLEQVLALRNVNHIRLHDLHSLQFGVEMKYNTGTYENSYAEIINPIGHTTAAYRLADKLSVNKFSTFLNYLVKPSKKLSTNFGFRLDYFSYNERTHISPRVSFSYKLRETTTVNGSIGVFYQNLPLLLLSHNKDNRDLGDLKATHYILGVEHLILDNTKVTVEMYQKDYSGFPLDPKQPGFFIIDELYYNYGFFTYHESLNSNGKAFTRGVELTVQKKLAKDFYGLTSISYSKARYSDEQGIWRARVYDNRIVFSIEGGYKPNNEWEISTRWIFAGGAPYTPFDLNLSRDKNRGILDINKINQTRYPDYHSLNVRADRRFHYNNSNLIFYLSVWNVYNRKNIASYYWKEKENKQDVIYQWGALPVIGLEYEF